MAMKTPVSATVVFLLFTMTPVRALLKPNLFGAGANGAGGGGGGGGTAGASGEAASPPDGGVAAVQEEHTVLTQAAENSATHENSKSTDPAHVTIPLDKEYVPVMRNNRTVMYKSAYFGTIFVGLPKPQEFTVVFDTGSAHLLVPSSKCASEACKVHRNYHRNVSGSALDVDHDGLEVPWDTEERDEVAIAYGTGEVVGEFARETVCLSERNGQLSEDALGNIDCVRVRTIFATEMTTEPFHAFKFDGVLGLGLSALALDPEFSFFGQFETTNPLMQPFFGVYVSQHDKVASEITFGGTDMRRVSGELRWANVTKPDLGYWQIKVRGITIGGEPLELCQAGDCVAIADTGTSLLGVPKEGAQHIHWLLARKVEGDPHQLINCQEHEGPEIVFDLGDVELVVGPELYSRPAGLQVVNKTSNETELVCRAALLPVEELETLGPKAFILGEPVLSKYYTTYNWREKRIGFGLSVHPDPDSVGEPRHRVYGAPPVEPPTPTVVYIE